MLTLHNVFGKQKEPDQITTGKRLQGGRSTTGICTGPHNLKHSSNIQSTISLSTGESEYDALIKGGLVWLGWQIVLQDFGLGVRGYCWKLQQCSQRPHLAVAWWAWAWGAVSAIPPLKAHSQFFTDGAWHLQPHNSGGARIRNRGSCGWAEQDFQAKVVCLDPPMILWLGGERQGIISKDEVSSTTATTA